MDNHKAPLDIIFYALADPTRRAVVQRLGLGPAAVKELASPFDMALPSFMKHISILEESGLIASEKVGRVRTCTIDPDGMMLVQLWMDQQREIWEGRADRLTDYIENRMNREFQDEK